MLSLKPKATFSRTFSSQGHQGRVCRLMFGGVGLAELCGCFLAATDEVVVRDLPGRSRRTAR
jgi:hypothetical protein